MYEIGRNLWNFSDLCIFDKNSVKSNVAMTFFPRDSAMVHLKSIAKSLGILQWFFAISKKSLGKKVIATFMRFHGKLNLHYKILPYSLFSKPYWNSLFRLTKYQFCPYLKGWRILMKIDLHCHEYLIFNNFGLFHGNEIQQNCNMYPHNLSKLTNFQSSFEEKVLRNKKNLLSERLKIDVGNS